MWGDSDELRSPPVSPVPYPRCRGGGRVATAAPACLPGSPCRAHGPMSLLAAKGRVYQYEQLRDISHLETLTMRSLILSGAAMLMATMLAGCGAESPTAENAPGLSAAVTADHSRQEFALDETYVNPCNGETVHLTGTLVGLTNIVDNGQHQEYHAVISETGTGLTTGASYTSHSTFHEEFNSPTPEAVNFTFSTRDAVHINSSTPGLSFTLLNTFHFVQAANGVFNKLTKDVESATCRG